MHLENDQVFNELFEEEFDKIPIIFRFNRKTSKIVIGIIVVFIAGASVFMNLFHDSGEFVSINSAAGYQAGFNVYNNNYMIGMIICLAVVVVLSAWLAIGGYLERRAFRKATRLSSMIHFAEKHRNEIKRQNDRLLRPY